MNRGFEDLSVRRKARELAADIYRSTADGAFAKDFSLKDQMRRASVSIASNIAEGHARESRQDTIRFLFIAKSSAAELSTQLYIAEDIEHLPAEVAQSLRARCEEIAGMLRGLIRSFQQQ